MANSFKNHFCFSKSQRLGILSLFVIIIALQLLYYLVDFGTVLKANPEEQKWLSLQSQISLEKQNRIKQRFKVYPYNPNFITDYKGYKLGLSVVQINRLLEFRKQGKFVNSATAFQKVTGISDSLLAVMAPNFKFPEFTKNKKEYLTNQPFKHAPFVKKEAHTPIDINQATVADFIKIYGIGEVIANRILAEKQKVGNFVAMEQLDAVWGLSPEVLASLRANFKVLVAPKITKININAASVKELAQFAYFKYALAKQIVIYRSMNGDFKNIADLTKIKDFPVDKAKIIDLYLMY